MYIYCILLLVPLAIQHFKIKWYKIDCRKKNKYALAFFFIMMTIMVAFRHQTIGNDTQNYIYFFERFSKLSWKQCGKEALELGFIYFNKFVSIFTEESQVFLAITAVVTVAMIYPTYKRLCVDPSLTIVLYVTMSTFIMIFSGIRQMLAIGIGFIAYECVRKEKLIPYILFVILAITFHSSAVMLVFMYPLYHLKITKKRLIVVVPVLAGTFVFRKKIFFVLGLMLSRFTKYDAAISQTNAFTMLIVLTFFAAFAFLIPEDDSLDAETIGLRNFLLFSVVLQMFASLHSIAMRMNYYYIIFIPLLLPKIIQVSNLRCKKIAAISRHILIVFFLVYFFFKAYMGVDDLNIFPYRFFWEEYK